jgi:hypothetical protein
MAMTAPLRACLVAAAVFAVPAAADAGAGDVAKPDLYDCDGTDELLLKEIDAAFESGIGFGETWDETVCEEGLLSVYAEGANGRWPDLRRKTPPKPKLPQKPVLSIAEARAAEDNFFALAMPIFGLGAVGFASVIAAVIGLFLRLRKVVRLDVPCPVCRTELPFIVGESANLFCPRCGGACRVDVKKQGATFSATAVPL